MTTTKLLRIGELLVHKRVISSSTLQHCLAVQSATSKKLGEILVQEKLLSPGELENILQEQHWRNSGFWVID